MEQPLALEHRALQLHRAELGAAQGVQAPQQQLAVRAGGERADAAEPGERAAREDGASVPDQPALALAARRGPDAQQAVLRGGEHHLAAVRLHVRCAGGDRLGRVVGAHHAGHRRPSGLLRQPFALALGETRCQLHPSRCSDERHTGLGPLLWWTRASRTRNCA